MLTLQMMQPGEIAEVLAERVRRLRLARDLSQRTLAARSGVSLASLKRFERTGLISLDGLLRISQVLEALGPLEGWLELPPATTIRELEARQVRRQRGRG